MFFKKDKKLGVAEGRRQYDLPLQEDEGTDFLMLLIALMTFLAVMALTGSLTLGAMAQRWSSGLENQLTIEIPAENGQGTLRAPEEIRDIESRVERIVKSSPGIVSYKVMDKNDITKLVAPWLGAEASITDLPLPGLVSVELAPGHPEALRSLQKNIEGMNAGVKIDTHQDWLGGLLRLTWILRFAAAVITAIIVFTTVAAVSGAIRARMAIHSKDLELLHLMGAYDEYIMRQFQKHAFTIALKAGLAGTAAALLTFVAGAYLSQSDTAFLLPDFSPGTAHILLLPTAPLLACLIAGLTARFTVLRALSRMP
ncbi:MAG: permease [Alphaproteobacteria bacterium]|nr:permease [Alphaproteobacteria bacterium]